jgi:DNA-binding NtrC family response regulator
MVPEMQNQVVALIVSGRLEDRRKLARILDILSCNVFIVGTLAHAREVLQLQPIRIIFCDERLSDGPYRELVAYAKGQHHTAQFFVMLTTGEWPEFLEALGLGVDAMRYPVHGRRISADSRDAEWVGCQKPPVIRSFGLICLTYKDDRLDPFSGRSVACQSRFVAIG